MADTFITSYQKAPVAGSTSLPSSSGPMAQTPLNGDNSEPIASAPLKPKRRFSFKNIAIALLVILTLIGVGSALYLTQIEQDVRQQAATCVYGTCGSPGSTSCVNGKTLACNGTCWMDSGQTCAVQNKTCWSTSCTSIVTANCPASHPFLTKPSNCTSPDPSPTDICTASEVGQCINGRYCATPGVPPTNCSSPGKTTKYFPE